jgi:hypothetical protein
MPRRVRNLCLAAVILSALVGLFAAAEALGLASLEERQRRVEESADQLAFLADPVITAAMAEAQVSALRGMKVPRALVLGALSIACALSFASGARLVRAGDLPREGLRRILSGSLLASAFLRTADGAMWASVAQRMGRKGAPMLARAHGDSEAAQLTEALIPTVMLAGVILHTALVAGAFLLLGQYFRSDKVKQVVALQDERGGH